MTRDAVKALTVLFLATVVLAGNSAAATVLLYDTSLASPPGVYFGTGNANLNFTVSQDGVTELGLSVITRYVGPIDPSAGSNVYTAPTGPPPPGHTGAAWGFTFSVNTQYSGGTADLGDFTYALTVVDLTAATSGPTFDPVRAIPDNTGFGASGKTAGVNLSAEWGAQNSESPSFAGFLPGFNPNANDLYKITLSELSSDGGTVLQSVSVFADATAPEPGTFGLFACSLAALACAGRKLARRSK
jgi:hypothetical protein